MREHLIGYLLGALEPEEHEQVAAQIARDPQLKQELNHVSSLLQPLSADRAHDDCPAGLAERTCRFVAQQIQTTLAPAPAAGGWRLTDMLVAAGIFFAATLLFFPAINQSRFAARVTQCQDNLHKIGVGMASYSMLHQGFFPNVPSDGRMSVAGICAVRLLEHGFLTDRNVLVCPASALADKIVLFRVPTLAEIETAHDAELEGLYRVMGGSYGYNLGYIDTAGYRAHRNQLRKTFVIVSDAPCSDPRRCSPNHSGAGHNVLFEDAHVAYLSSCKAKGCTDDIFLNDNGEVAAGVHVHDTVIGASHTRPLPRSVEVPLGGKK